MKVTDLRTYSHNSIQVIVGCVEPIDMGLDVRLALHARPFRSHPTTTTAPEWLTRFNNFSTAIHSLECHSVTDDLAGVTASEQAPDTITVLEGRCYLVIDARQVFFALVYEISARFHLGRVTFHEQASNPYLAMRRLLVREEQSDPLPPKIHECHNRGLSLLQQRITEIYPKPPSLDSCRIRPNTGNISIFSPGLNRHGKPGRVYRDLVTLNDAAERLPNHHEPIRHHHTVYYFNGRFHTIASVNPQQAYLRYMGIQYYLQFLWHQTRVLSDLMSRELAKVEGYSPSSTEDGDVAAMEALVRRAHGLRLLTQRFTAAIETDRVLFDTGIERWGLEPALHQMHDTGEAIADFVRTRAMKLREKSDARQNHLLFIISGFAALTVLLDYAQVTAPSAYPADGWASRLMSPSILALASALLPMLLIVAFFVTGNRRR